MAQWVEAVSAEVMANHGAAGVVVGVLLVDVASIATLVARVGEGSLDAKVEISVLAWLVVDTEIEATDGKTGSNGPVGVGLGGRGGEHQECQGDGYGQGELAE
jgi:hypothetical protein